MKKILIAVLILIMSIAFGFGITALLTWLGCLALTICGVNAVFSWKLVFIIYIILMMLNLIRGKKG